MKPMQLVPMVWWIHHPFLSLDPFPSIFASTIRRIFLFHTLSNPPRLSWSMHDFRKLLRIFHDVRFKWITFYDLFSFCIFSNYEIWDIDFEWKKYKTELNRHVELILTIWKEIIKEFCMKFLWNLNAIKKNISDKNRKRNKFFKISPIKFQRNFNKNNKKIPISFLLIKLIQFPPKFHHLKKYI